MGSCCSSVAKGKSGSTRDGQVTDAFTTSNKQKQRQGSERWRKKSSGLVPMVEAELLCISGRMFLNGASKVACLYTQQGKKGTNQDAMLVWEVWDVLSNKEAIDIVASAPSRTTAARALVDCATRAWRLKYPTSKNDDCAVVCLFLECLPASNGAMEENDVTRISKESGERMVATDDNKGVSHALSLDQSGTFQGSTEIVPVTEPTEEKLSSKFPGQSKRSLAECISVADDEEWSALDGITRVNSLLSLPRFLSGDKGSTSRRKWF